MQSTVQQRSGSPKIQFMPRRQPTSNAAQRLYDVLEKHDQALQARAANGYDAVWVHALGITTDQVTEKVAQAFGLIGEIDRALATTGDSFQRRNFQLHKENWARAFVPGASGRSQGVVSGDTSVESRAALGGIASHLRDNLPEGRLPTDEERQGVRDDVEQLISDLRDDETIPVPVLDLFLRRLHDMLWALDHLAIMGPDGIAAVCERMAVALVFASREVAPTEGQSVPEGQRQLFDRFGGVIKKASDLVSVPGAWYGTAQAVLALEPIVETVRQLAGG